MVRNYSSGKNVIRTCRRRNSQVRMGTRQDRMYLNISPSRDVSFFFLFCLLAGFRKIYASPETRERKLHLYVIADGISFVKRTDNIENLFQRDRNLFLCFHCPEMHAIKCIRNVTMCPVRSTCKPIICIIRVSTFGRVIF